jgi:hypothetical protein
MSDTQVSGAPGSTAGADLQAFSRKERPTSDFQLHMDEQTLEYNRNYLADAQTAVAHWEIDVKGLSVREKEGRGICDQIGQLAKSHPEFVRDLEKAKAVLGKITAAKEQKEQNLANARVRVKQFEDAVTASHTPAIQRAEKVRRLMKQMAG